MMSVYNCHNVSVVALNDQVSKDRISHVSVKDLNVVHNCGCIPLGGRFLLICRVQNFGFKGMDGNA